MIKKTGSKKTILEKIGKEMKSNPPRVLAKTRAKAGPKAAAAQKTAILLNKARRAGAMIKKPSRK